MLRKLPIRDKSAPTIETKFLSNLLPADQISITIIKNLYLNSLCADYVSLFIDLRRVQKYALYYAFDTIFNAIHQPLLNELNLKHGFPASKKIVGKIQVEILGKPTKFRILNTFSTFGPNTSLEIEIPIQLIYDLHIQSICDWYDVTNDIAGRRLLRFRSVKPGKSAILFLIKSLSKTRLLVTSQRCSSVIRNYLLFSINTNFLS